MAMSRIPGPVVFIVAMIVLSSASIAAGTALDDRDSNVFTQPVPLSDGSLRVDPKPLTLEEVRRTPAGSPARSLFELFFWAQWGSAPNVVAAYPPEVARAVGADILSGAYAQQRVTLLSSLPRITSTVKTAFGVVVTVELLRRNAVPARQSFTLRRVEGRWLVVYDTLLEDGIAAYVQNREAPASGKQVPDAAIKAGMAAAARYRSVALHSIGLTPAEAP